jgi:hypothetical protein
MATFRQSDHKTLANTPAIQQNHTAPHGAVEMETTSTSHVLSLIEELDDQIDDLEESLAPLVKTTLSETASKLPLLDKAKLYVLVTYAIESILFCVFFPLAPVTPSNWTFSVFATQWRQGARASRFQRTHPREAVL